MERSGLLLSGDNKALATMLHKVLRHSVEPFFATGWWDGGGKCYCQRVKLGDTSDPCGQRAREKLHLRSPQRQAMIRRRAGDARRWLHHVQPVPTGAIRPSDTGQAPIGSAPPASAK